MLTSDRCGGFRQSTYNSSVYYAVSTSSTWDKTKYYRCPCGYHWATTEEGKKIFKNNKSWSGKYVYSTTVSVDGADIDLEVSLGTASGSATTNACKHAGNKDEYQVQYTSNTMHFAGVVCIKD